MKAFQRLVLAVAALPLAASCNQVTCDPTDKVAASVEGMTFLVPKWPTTYVGSEELLERENSDGNEYWSAYCAAPNSIAKTDRIGMAIAYNAFTEDVGELKSAYRADLQRKNAKPAWDSYTSNGTTYNDPETGLARRDWPSVYMLKGQSLGEWAHPLEIECQTSLTDFCELRTNFDGNLEIVLTIEREKVPVAAWPGMLAKADSIFRSWRVGEPAQAEKDH